MRQFDKLFGAGRKSTRREMLDNADEPGCMTLRIRSMEFHLVVQMKDFQH